MWFIHRKDSDPPPAAFGQLRDDMDRTDTETLASRKNVSIKHLNYSECGFLIFNTEHPIHETFWKNMMKMYDDGDLFKEKEWHDSYIFDVVRKKLEKTKNVKNFDITNNGLVDVKNDDHVFVSSVLGKFMDHKKGNRKDSKWSFELITRIKKEKENKL